MAAQVSKKSDIDTEKYQLSKQDIQLTLVMFTSLLIYVRDLLERSTLRRVLC
jgi:hypothetical protein